MKTRLLLLITLLLIVSVNVNVQGQTEGPVLLEIVTTPEPLFNQIDYDTIYHFVLNIRNLNLDLEEDDLINPGERFSGNLVLYLSFTVSKEWALQVGPTSRYYVTPLQKYETSYDISLPKVGDSDSIPFQYDTSNKGYDSSVGLDDWITFTMEVQLYVEHYREIDGDKKFILGDLLGEKTLKYYVISRTKIDYVGEVLDEVGSEIIQARARIANIEGQIGEDFNVGLGTLESLYTAMYSAIEDGDYVTAISLYEGYTPTWENDLIDTLLDEIEAKKVLESDLDEALVQLEELTWDFQTIESSLVNLTASHQLEVQDLEDELSAAKTNSRLYIFGIAVAVIALVLVILRSMRRTV
jgi:hypothetical protein